jgi:hypothetical protein
MKHNEEAYWIKSQCQQSASVEWSQISEMEVTQVLRKTLNWKAPGGDRVANFWLKHLTATHTQTHTNTYLVTLCNKRIEEGQIPDWLMIGMTVLIPKNEKTERPKNYRPTTCLTTIHITATSVRIKRIPKYIDDRHLMSKEQKGCCRGLKGCKDQILISAAILQ